MGSVAYFDKHSVWIKVCKIAYIMITHVIADNNGTMRSGDVHNHTFGSIEKKFADSTPGSNCLWCTVWDPHIKELTQKIEIIDWRKTKGDEFDRYGDLR